VQAQSLTAEPGLQKVRLDRFVTAHLAPEYSRSQVTRMIDAGLVAINGVRARAASMVRAGDRVDISIATRPTPPAVSKPEFEVEVLFADSELIVVNKPPGIVVHAAPGHRGSTLVDSLMARFPELSAMVEPDGVIRPGIVHRLDRDTSGVMVVARTPFARTDLSRQFKDRTVGKIYLALVRGLVSGDEFTVHRAIGRHPVERKRMSVHARKAREATTKFSVLARFAPETGYDRGTTLIMARPETGRTHQIRVHLASIGHPCLGDRVYGKRGQTGDEMEFGRQALHSFALTLAHPRSRARLEFVAPLPTDFSEFLQARGWGVELEKIRSGLRD
jgi:23S rRNA pseudouridine1911/1915/1917 synthase